MTLYAALFHGCFNLNYVWVDYDKATAWFSKLTADEAVGVRMVTLAVDGLSIQDGLLGPNV